MSRGLAVCGIDLHASTISVCILDGGLVVAAKFTFSLCWISGLCTNEKLPVVLGHALATKAINGGKAKNDKIAVLLRGGMLPRTPPTARGTVFSPEKFLHS